MYKYERNEILENEDIDRFKLEMRHWKHPAIDFSYMWR